jgi:hypothetical protein
MSHIATITTRVHDSAAVTLACQRLNLTPPTQGSVQLFSGEATGLIVQLPGWQYPAAIDTSTGAIRYDNYEGAWGDQNELDRFLQAYAVEKTHCSQCTSCYVLPEQFPSDTAGISPERQTSLPASESNLARSPFCRSFNSLRLFPGLVPCH